MDLSQTHPYSRGKGQHALAAEQAAATMTPPDLANERRSGWRRIHFASAILTMGFVGAAAWQVRPGSPAGQINEGLILFLIALLTMGLNLLARYQIGRTPQSARPADRAPAELRIRWQPMIWGAVALLIVVQVNLLTAANKNDWSLLWNLSHHLQIGLFFGGIGLILWGGVGAPDLRPRFPRIQWNAYGLSLLVILGVALMARLWNLETAIHRFLDEMHYANAVARLWYEGGQHILLPFSDQVTAFTWLFPYAQSWTSWLTGPSLAGLRMTSVLFGLAQIGAVIFLARTLFDRQIALLAALFLATFPLHIHFSRMGINNIADPVFGTLTMAFLARGFQHGRRVDFALAGACLGLTQYFYEGGRLFYPPFIICWIGWLTLFARRDARFHIPHWKNIAAFVGMALVLIGPLYFVWTMHNKPITPRFEAMRLTVDETTAAVENNLVGLLQNQIVTPILGFVNRPETSWFYGGDQPFILLPLVPLFLIGIAVVFWRLRTPGGSLLFWWLAAAVAGNALIRDSLAAPRYLVVFPGVMILLALGLREALLLLNGGRSLKKWGWRLTVLLAVGLGAFQLTHYLATHLPNYYVDQYYSLRDGNGIRIKDEEDAMLRAMLLPDNSDAHIISRGVIWTFNTQTIPYFYGRRDEVRIAHMFPPQFDQEYIDKLPRYLNHAFFIEPEDAESYWLIRSNFDLTGPFSSPYGLPAGRQFLMYFAPNYRNYQPETAPR